MDLAQAMTELWGSGDRNGPSQGVLLVMESQQAVADKDGSDERILQIVRGVVSDGEEMPHTVHVLDLQHVALVAHRDWDGVDERFLWHRYPPL